MMRAVAAMIDLAALVLHLLGACIWTGGHLVLCLTVLPRALAQRSTEVLSDFESGFERIGIPALGLQVLTGLWLVVRMLSGLEGDARWHVLGVTTAKVLLLALTIGFAVHARMRLIPQLTPDRLRLLAYHIIAVTILSVLFVIVGVAFRMTPG
jgi:putative copper export protein